MSVLLSGYAQNREGGDLPGSPPKRWDCWETSQSLPSKFPFCDMHLSLPSDWPPLPSGCGVALLYCSRPSRSERPFKHFSKNNCASSSSSCANMMSTLEILKCTPRTMWLGTPNCGLKKEAWQSPKILDGWKYICGRASKNKNIPINCCCKLARVWKHKGILQIPQRTSTWHLPTQHAF